MTDRVRDRAGDDGGRPLEGEDGEDREAGEAATNPDVEQSEAERRALVRQRVREARDRRRWWRRARRRARRVLLVTGVLAVVALAVAGWAAWSARAEMLDGRVAMEQGRAALLRGDTQGALVGFDKADAAFATAEHRLSWPYVRGLEVLPALGANLRAARMLAGAGGLLADAGAEVGAATVGLPDGVASIAPRDGVIPILSLAQVAPALRQASDLTSQAAAVGEAAPARFLLGQVAEARTELLTQVAEADSLLAVAAELSDALPALLGADAPKRYFLGAANLAELRGTGGFIGAYAVLTADRGRVSIGGFDSVVRLESARLPSDLDGPNRSYDRRYSRFGGAGYWQNINMTPDFPTAAEAMVNLYEHDTGERLDGAIVVDPFALQALLRVAGAVEVPRVGQVTAQDVVEVVSVASYELLGSADRKPLLGQVAAAALERFLGQPDAGDLAGGARALAESAGGGHLLLYSSDADVQESLEAVGVAGGLVPEGGDLLAVVGNNAAANKADFFVDRSVDYQVFLNADGSATSLVDVALTNETPTSGQPLDVIGPHPDTGLAAGDNLTYLSVFCAPGCDLRSSGTTDPAATERAEELGLPVFSTWETVPAGQTREVAHALHRPDGWQRDGEDGTYRLTVRNQPTARPSTLSVQVHLPPGARVAEHSSQFTQTGGTLVWSGNPRGRTATFDVAFTLPGEGNALQRTVRRSVDWWQGVLGE